MNGWRQEDWFDGCGVRPKDTPRPDDASLPMHCGLGRQNLADIRGARMLRSPQDAMLKAALRRFAVDPLDPLLRTHKLKGDLDGYWAFSVDDDLRALFRRAGDTFTLVALGGHDEVY